MAQKNLSVKLSLNDKQFQSGLKKATRSIKKFGSSMKRTGQTLSRNLTLPLVAFGAASIAAFDKQQKAIAQVEAGIKSTGGAAGLTSKQLQRMASELQGKTLFGDEVILKDATSQLLTFTNIAGEQFARTQVAALNLATRLDGDLKSSSIQLGKALNDPIANLSALSRSGIQFSEEQKKVIKELASTNRLAEAQTLILDELDKQYGGAAEAAAQAGAGGLKQLQNQFGDLMEQIGGMLIPIVIDLGNQIKSFLEGFAKLSPEVKKMIVTFGILAGALGPLLVVFGSIVGIVTTLSIKFIAIAAAIAALALGVLYVNDNWAAFIERFKDIDWWKNALLEMIALLIEYNPITSLFNSFNKFLEYLNVAQIPSPFEKGADFFRDMKTDLKDYENDFQDFGTFIDNQGKKIKKALKGIGVALNVGGGVSTTNTQALGPVAQAPSTPTDSVNNLFSAINANLPFPQIDESPFTGLVVKTEEEIGKLTEAFNTMQNKIKETEGTFSSSFASMSADADTSFRDIGNAALNSARQVIKAAIGQAIASQISKVIATVPFPFNLALAAGAGTAVSALFDKVLPAFADGGLVTGATLGLVGEGPGTSMSNPEVIAPLDKLKSMIGEGQGSVEVFGRISGSDILISSDRARKNRDRTRGY
mgnify:CR=1 FL=1